MATILELTQDLNGLSQAHQCLCFEIDASACTWEVFAPCYPSHTFISKWWGVNRVLLCIMCLKHMSSQSQGVSYKEQLAQFRKYTTCSGLGEVLLILVCMLFAASMHWKIQDGSHAIALHWMLCRDCILQCKFFEWYSQVPLEEVSHFWILIIAIHF